MKSFLLLLVLLVSPVHGGLQSFFGIGTEQSAAVKGTLLCFGKPAADISVRLVDVDLNSADDVMDEGTTNKDGHFSLAGSETEVGDVTATLKIFHKCNYDGICSVEVKVTLPQEYVVAGPKANETFDVGTINLEDRNKYRTKTSVCIKG